MKGRTGVAGFTLIELMIVIGVIALIAAIAIPNLFEARKSGNESSAIQTLRTVCTSQTMFREYDKDRDGISNFATDVAQLRAAGLVDPNVGTGTKNGYAFVMQPVLDSEFQWVMTAVPVAPGNSGDRYFYVDETGVIRFQFLAPATSSSPAVGN